MAELDGIPVTAQDLQALALTSYGNFTSMRVENGRVRGLDLHLNRLERDSLALFGTSVDRGSVRNLIRWQVPATDSVVVRVTVFDPGLGLGNPDDANAPRTLVTTRPAAHVPAEPLRVTSRTCVRDVPEIKSTGLFPTIWHRRQARLAGYDDALFTDREGFVAEGATWNVGFYDGAKIIWPQANVLPGVTMEILKSVHEYVERPVPADGLGGFVAAFATNAAIGVRAIAEINGTTFDAKHPVIEQLRSAYLVVPTDRV